MFRSSLYNSARQLNARQLTARSSFHTTGVKYSIVDGAKEVLQKANKKTGEVLASTMETAEDKAPEAVKDHPEKQKVHENTKGYKDLQDKGSKAEAEQNRAEDGV